MRAASSTTQTDIGVPTRSRAMIAAQRGALARAGLAHLDLFDLQHLGAAGAVHADGSGHGGCLLGGFGAPGVRAMERIVGVTASQCLSNWDIDLRMWDSHGIP